MSDATISRLRQVPLFSELGDDDLAAIADLTTEFEAPAGQVLVEHGQAGMGLFVIESGEVRVDRPHGEDIDLGPGDFFGELAVLADVTRTARVTTVTPLRALAISRNDLMDLLGRQASVAVAMLREVARRLAAVT